MDAPGISVVIPTGSVDADLLTQLRAVTAQASDIPFEVVVSLNTPAPAARTALDAMLAELGDARVRWIDSSASRGAAPARNAGAEAARGELLLFCDGDDIVRPGWIANLSSALTRAEGGFDAVSGLCVDFSEEGDVPKWLAPPPDDELPRFMGRPYLLSGNLGIHRSAFQKVHGFDSSLTRCEDVDMSWRLVAEGLTIGFEPTAVLDYRIRPSLWTMLRQHYFYGIGQTEVLLRHPDGDGSGAGSALRANNAKGGLRSPVAVLRKVAIASGRVAGLVQAKLGRGPS